MADRIKPSTIHPATTDPSDRRPNIPTAELESFAHPLEKRPEPASILERGRPGTDAEADAGRRRLSVGILLPQEEGPGDPPPSWELMSTAARVAEDVGLDSVWLVDHFLRSPTRGTPSSSCDPGS